jgi:hypothetical protein
MDKEQNKFGLYFNAKGSNLSSGTTGDLSDLLYLIEFKGEFDDEPTAEAIKIVLTEREVYFPENYRLKAPGGGRIRRPAPPRLLPEEPTSQKKPNAEYPKPFVPPPAPPPQ